MMRQEMLVSKIEGVRQGMTFLMHAIGNLIWPPVCANCGKRIDAANHLCGTCWQSMHWIDKPYCPISGLPYAFDVGEEIISPSVIVDPPVYDKARAVALYDDTARALVHKLKYYDRTDLARSMGQWMVRAGLEFFDENPDQLVVVPVPLHRRRLIGRRYNQAALLAKEIAAQQKAPYLHDCLVRRRATRQQVGLNESERASNVRGAFQVPLPLKGKIAGKAIILVDDVMTTGATMQACARVLRQAGAAQIFVIVFARVVEPGQMTI
ncbi:ComF family protein [Cohaesibacter gelatinilyticus]|uniref:ComF family protein n=1 Tax=Cohaesibacter gelatinilyticus TaxID=372072 RepID=A0A285PGH8_9HYPH|nr:ComF family protein [Cohaesibacter gelatinilyticus]SNZ20799.1 comF family protein [Cohaesibacter gelatinilyticus]